MKNVRGLFILVAFFAIYWFVFRTDYGDKLEFNGTEVYYTDQISLEEAERMGNYLVETSFADGNPKSVQLDKRDSTYLFRMVVKEGTTEDSSLDLSFEAMAILYSLQVFDNAPVELEACDNTFKTLKVYGKKP